MSEMTTRTEQATRSTADRRLAEFLLPAIWFGLITGLAEVSLLFAAKIFLHRFIFFFEGPLIWMDPVGVTVIFLVPAVACYVVAWPLPGLGSLRVRVFVFAFLSFVSLLFLVTQLHAYAALALAAGLAAQTAYLISTHPAGFRSLVRGTIGWLAVLIIGLAIGGATWQWLAERRALAKLPSAPSNAPNVLLVVLDTVRAEDLSLYGYARHTTPRLELLAKRGVVFDQAVSTAPWTLASHASMFTGRYPHELSVGWAAPLDGSYPTLAESLSAKGYATAGFVANYWACSKESGLSRGFAHYESDPALPKEIILSSSLGRSFTDVNWIRKVTNNYEIFGRKSAAEVNQAFLDWLPRTGQKPFFAFLNYYDAHDPRLPPKPFADMFGPSKPGRIPHLWPTRKWSSGEIQTEVDAYDGSIAYLDHNIGLLLDELNKRGLLENTLVIITSDHGEEFGEHGLMGHGNSLYFSSVHVPLLMSLPSRIPAGIRVSEPTTLRDIPGTVLDLLRLGGKTEFPGASLARFWNQDGAPHQEGTLLSEVSFAQNLPDWFPVSKGDMKALISDRYHFIQNGDGREELYDLNDDPWEQNDLAGTEHGREMLVRFRSSLNAALARN